jgi:transcriptional regulator with XRE-family HTH domain
MAKTRKIRNPEFGVDSRYKNLDSKLLEGKILMEARLERLNRLSRHQIVKARLLQLKLRMEEYLQNEEYSNYSFFTSFLTDYIDTIYEKRTLFAEDMKITPVSLSQILNNHRDPNEEFLLKLLQHSELTFKKFFDFPKEIWFKVYYYEKIHDTIENHKRCRTEVKNRVRIKNAALQ